jgi:hypothetical protein
MLGPSVVSNGAKVREDETEVLGGSREAAVCLASDWGRIPIPPEKRASRRVVGGRDGSKPLGRMAGYRKLARNRGRRAGAKGSGVG